MGGINHELTGWRHKRSEKNASAGRREQAGWEDKQCRLVEAGGWIKTLEETQLLIITSMGRHCQDGGLKWHAREEVQTWAQGDKGGVLSSQSNDSSIRGQRKENLNLTWLMVTRRSHVCSQLMLYLSRGWVAWVEGDHHPTIRHSREGAETVFVPKREGDLRGRWSKGKGRMSVIREWETSGEGRKMKSF